MSTLKTEQVNIKTADFNHELEEKAHPKLLAAGVQLDVDFGASNSAKVVQFMEGMPKPLNEESVTPSSIKQKYKIVGVETEKVPDKKVRPPIISEETRNALIHLSKLKGKETSEMFEPLTREESHALQSYFGRTLYRQIPRHFRYREPFKARSRINLERHEKASKEPLDYRTKSTKELVSLIEDDSDHFLKLDDDLKGKEELQVAYVKKFNSLNNIPSSLWHASTCKAAIQKNKFTTDLLAIVLDERADLIDLEMARLLVSFSPESVFLLPDNIQKSEGYEALLLHACRKDVSLVGRAELKAKLEEAEEGFYDKLCHLKGSAFSDLPEIYQTREMLFTACSSIYQPEKLTIPNHLKNEETIAQAVALCPTLFLRLSESERSEKVCKALCSKPQTHFVSWEHFQRKVSSPLKFVPEAIKQEWSSKDYLQVVRCNHYIKLDEIPEKKLTADILLELCRGDSYTLIEAVQKFKTLEDVDLTVAQFELKACLLNRDNIGRVSLASLNTEFLNTYLTGVSMQTVHLQSVGSTKNAKAIAQYILDLPEANKSKLLDTKAKRYFLLRCIKDSDLEQSHHSLDTQNKVLIEQSILETFIYFSDAEKLEFFKIVTSPEIRESLIKIIIMTSKGNVLQLLLGKGEYEDDEQEDFGDYLTPQESEMAANFLFKSGEMPNCNVEANELYDEVNPLLRGNFRRETHNPFLFELLSSCYQHTDFKPRNFERGEELETKVAQFTASASKEIRTELPESQLDYKVISGRTIRAEKGDCCHHLKIQRKGEEFEDLAREAGYYDTLSKTPELENRLKSSYPKFEGLFKIPCEVLDAQGHQFKDDLEKIEVDGKQYYQVFHYTASKKYGLPAFRVTNPENASKGKEGFEGLDGIYNAIHDIGVFASQGIVFTSVIPAFHNITTARRLLMFHSLFGQDVPFTQTGVFESWLAQATDQPDIGHDGLRDIGDSVLFSKIRKNFSAVDLHSDIHPEDVQERLLFGEFLAQGLFASQVLVARFMRENPNYHYKNPQSCKEVREILENCMTLLMQGYFNDYDLSLQEVLNLSNEDYENYFNETAKEMIYWSAKQPDEDELKENPNYPKSEEHFQSDTYSADVSRGRLSTEVYPNNHSVDVEFSKDFLWDNEYQLGRGNGLLVFTKLIRGITHAVTSLLNYQAQQAKA
ncbi:hypothetical protein SOPP22_16090 [Shewanella sp. OPT22]|nr:hypothetical protein SOPP22_16090 [Shewanella sp. OPT22]